MDDRVTIVLILLLFTLLCLVLVVQDYGSSGHQETKNQLKKIIPAIFVPSGIFLVGGLLYLFQRNAPSDYDVPILTGYCFLIFIASILTLHASFYKVNLS